MAKSLKLLVVMLASLAVTIFLFRHQNADPSTWVTVLFMMTLVYVPFAVPSVGEFIVGRPRAVFWAGIALIVGGLTAMFGLIFASSFYGFPRGIAGSDPISIATMWIMIAGIFLAILPRSMAALKRTEKAGSTAKADKPVKNGFHGVGEAWAAILTVLRNWAPFAQSFGPWIVLLWAVPFLGLHIVAYHSGIAPTLFDAPVGKIDAATEVLSERLPMIVVSAFAFPIALVSWHRYVLRGAAGAFEWNTPGNIARYLWRLWMVSILFSVLLRVVAGNASDLARLLGTQDKLLVAKVLFWAFGCALVYVGSSSALVFPAVATGNRNFIATDSLRVTRPLGNSFRVGFVLSLAPFGCAWWGAATLLERLGLTGPHLTLPAYTLWLIPTTLLFLGLASCATYLSRVYVARGNSPDDSDQFGLPVARPSPVS
jgi:hypothetical protein